MPTEAITDSAGFRRAIEDYETDLRERTGQPLYRPEDLLAGPDQRAYGEQREALATAVDGLDLTPAEWRTLRWFLDWDNVDALASIITKARVSAPSVTQTEE